jgi:ferrous-iron efflux pump FieF
MDEEVPAEMRRSVESALKALVDDRSIRDWHGLRTRSAGRGSFVEVHLEMDGDLPLQEAHARGDRAMAEIQKVLPRSQVLVHLDVERDEPET